MARDLPLRILLAQPRGFCAGVVRAVEIVERALKLYGAPIYVRHEIVHNRHVVEDLRAQGAIFVEDVEEIPEGARTVFSAHGVPRSVERAAAARGLSVVDATCPLVQRVHVEGRRYAQRGYDVVLVGHVGHAEVEGTCGQIDGRVHVVGSIDAVGAIEVKDERKVAYVTQTTLSLLDTREIVDALKRRFPAIVGPETRDICYATQNRQMAVADLAPRVDMLVVIGSSNSSNSNRLRELGESLGAPSRLIDDASLFDPDWLDGVRTMGLTAGASAPEHVVQATIARLRTLRDVTVETLDGLDETVRFKLPPPLLEAAVH